jgi:hypothetical protein
MNVLLDSMATFDGNHTLLPMFYAGFVEAIGVHYSIFSAANRARSGSASGNSHSLFTPAICNLQVPSSNANCLFQTNHLSRFVVSPHLNRMNEAHVTKSGGQLEKCDSHWK